MSIRKFRFIKIIPVLILAFVFVDLDHSEVKSNMCATTAHCVNTNQWVTGFVTIRGGSCHFISYYTCNGNDSDCREDYVDKFDDIGCAHKIEDNAGCCVANTTSCTDCTAPSCPTGTSETVTSFGTKTTSCSKGDGCGSNTRTCYCTSACTPQSCAAGYSTTDLGAGIAASYSCTNDCASTTTRNCYYYPCSDCTLTCPVSSLFLSPTNVYPVTSTSCTKGGDCRGDAKTGICYEAESPQPYRTNLGINYLPESSADYTALGFNGKTSGTSGIYSSTTIDNGANQPVEVTATFRDTLAGDIEAMSFWFTETKATPSTPYYISSTSTQSARTSTNSDFGFMLHREDSSWIPYIPSISSYSTADDLWVRAQSVLGVYYIKGPTGGNMVGISDIVVTASGTDVTVTYKIRFLSVSNGRYYVYTLANDVFSFTPRDNYSSYGVTNTYWNAGEIRNSKYSGVANYARNWNYTNKTWDIDLTEPFVQGVSVNVQNDNQTVRVNWLVHDDSIITPPPGMEIVQFPYAAVLNIYSTEPRNITVAIDGTSRDYTTIPEPDANSIGNLLDTANAFIFPQGGNSVVGSNNVSGYADITVPEDITGNLIFYLTVFDNGGNYDRSSTSFNFDDWLITKGGLVYSSNGSDMNVKDLSSWPSPGPWNTSLLYTSGKFDYRTADVSSELLGSTIGSLNLIHTSSGSYELLRMTDMGINPTIYNDYLEAFQKKAMSVGSILEYTGDFSGNMCTTSGCNVYSVIPGATSTTNISSGFACNGKGAFFIEGNLSITPDVTNVNTNRDACIFVVGGDVTINPNTIDSGYDEINAYILSGGQVTILPDATNYDGVLLKGGVYSPNSNIDIQRRIALGDRNIFPVFAVSSHPKYGLWAKDVFGNKINLIKTEVGFKPY